jgi:peptidoglycan endopeptidase LytE
MKKVWVSKRRKGHRLYIPNNMMAGAKTKLAALKAKRRPARISRAAERISGIHKVRRGESLYKIARKYGTTIRKIKARNALRRNKIFVGQKLKVLKKATMKKKLYTVKSGDSLYKIARKHGTTVRKIKARNSLQKSKILVGQKLKILKKAVLKKKLYIVKRGDSLYRIARKFGLTVNSIVSANSLRNKTIYPSQKIYLPRLL